MKLQDETMHSGADVEAFTAALNRDIEGDTSVVSHPSDSDTGEFNFIFWGVFWLGLSDLVKWGFKICAELDTLLSNLMESMRFWWGWVWGWVAFRVGGQSLDFLS